MTEETLRIIISANTDRLIREINDARDSVEDFSDESEKHMKAFDSAVSQAKEAAGAAMKGIATAIAGTITAMVALVESTEELRANQAKLQSAFEAAGGSAEVAAEVYANLYRVLGDDGQATEAAQHLAKLTTNQEELAEWTEICQGVYATFGDSLPLEGLTEAINHTAQLGEVQGPLADALEWSGINVEDFNKELAKSTKTSERAKKISETLKKTYDNAAKTYEKNAKKTLEANEAQNELNKAMANAGDYMAPVATELKNIGASLLNHLEEPMKDVVDFLTNTVLPAISSVIDFIFDHQAEVIAVIAGITAGIVAFKVATIAATLAQEGMTLATTIATAAQAAFNAIMAANPIGLVATALAALTVGIIAYVAATGDAEDETSKLSEETEELIEDIHEEKEALDASKEAYEKKAGAIQAEGKYHQDLVKELDNYVAADGRVKDADKARVDFILGQLNEAYGTEWKVVDGVVQKYDELKTTIQEVIDTKIANTLLEAKNADYVAAIQSEDGALSKLNKAYENYMAQREISTKKIDEWSQEIQESETGVWEALWATITFSDTKIEKLGKNINKELETLNEVETAYDEALTNYGGYYTTIQEYEEATALVQQGKAKEAIDLLKGKGDAYFEYSKEVDAATQSEIDTLYKAAVDAGLAAAQTKKNYEDGVEGYTEEMVKESEDAYDEALEAWADVYDGAHDVGEDLGGGLKAGMEGTVPGLIAKAKNIISNIWKAMRKEADSHSPSKKTMRLGGDMGEGLEIGMEDSSKDTEKAARNLIKDTLAPIEETMRGVKATNFNGAFSTMAASLAHVSTSHSITSIDSSVLGTIAASLAGDSTQPIILQVDGKTFAQTSISTINELTRQTGTLSLNII